MLTDLYPFYGAPCSQVLRFSGFLAALEAALVSLSPQALTLFRVADFHASRAKGRQTGSCANRTTKLSASNATSKLGRDGTSALLSGLERPVEEFLKAVISFSFSFFYPDLTCRNPIARRSF